MVDDDELSCTTTMDVLKSIGIKAEWTLSGEAEARETGIRGFISKPLFKSTLYHALCPYMDMETEHDQTTKQNTNLSGCRILLAEDNELNWEVAKELLSDLVVELDWAEDGRICLDKFQKSPEGYYDAILMDI